MTERGPAAGGLRAVPSLEERVTALERQVALFMEALADRPLQACPVCEKPVVGNRSTYCSVRCRQTAQKRAYRARKAQQQQ